MKSLYYNLASDGIKRHRRLYYPFIGTTVFFIVLINLCLSIRHDPDINNLYGMQVLNSLLGLGSVILTLIGFGTLYQNYNFIQKNKSDESGLFLILGMERKHLVRVFLNEILILFLKSIFIGTLISIVIYKLVLVIFLRLINSDINALEGGIFPLAKPLIITFVIFFALFVVLLIMQAIRSKFLSPIGFMKEAKAGEKPPRFPLLRGVLGIVFIGIGYYISLTNDNPIKALHLLFTAVTFVVYGTYAAFTVIISKALNLIKRNKNFYYKKSNFTAISGLIHRVKNSASTLATIAILSTMVIVVLTSGFSLYFGTVDRQNNMFPYDYILAINKGEESLDYYKEEVNKVLKNHNKKPSFVSYKSSVLPVDIVGKEIKNIPDNYSIKEMLSSDGAMFVLDEDSTYDFGDYDAITFSDDIDINSINSINLKVKRDLEENYPKTFAQNDLMMDNWQRIVIKNPKLFYKIISSLNPKGSLDFDESWYINFDLDNPYDPELIQSLHNEFKEIFGEEGYILKDGQFEKQELLNLYASIFFVGIILGLGFLVSTVLAIYYKQLSEGLYDKDRFKTMRQLGMTDKEAKKSISKQMSLVFFLPLIFAFTHSLFALPIITQFLKVVGLTSKMIFVKCLLVVFAAYIIFYLVTFKLTEKTYNHIVLDEN